jgi:hypothetical protein
MAEKIVVDIEFQTNVKKISADLESVKDTLAETNESLDDIAKTGKGTETALGKIGKGFKGMGLAMKAMGVGLIIEAFKFLKDIMMQNQTVMDGVAVVTETLGVVFNQITSVVTDVFNAVSESSEGFEGMKAVIGGLMTIAITPLKLAFYGITKAVQEGQLAWEQSFFGDGDPETIARLNEKLAETNANLKEVVEDVVDAGTQIATNIGEAVTELGSVVTIAVDVATEGIKEISLEQSLATGRALADAKKNEELLEVLRAKQQLQSQLEAELQRQIRDDVRLTFEERIAANEELGRILEEQTLKEKAVADEKVRIAALELSTQKDSIELQTKYQQTLLEQIDIDERIAGLRSEQLTNEAGLQQELFDAQNEIQLATMTAREQELLALEQDYNAKLELSRKAGEDDVAITEQYNALVLAADEKFAQEDLDVQKKLDEEKTALAAQQLDVVQNSIKMAGDLFEEGTAASKVAGVASATIDTWKAVNMALASAPPPLSYISAGLSLATGLKSIKNILSVKTKKPTPTPSPGDTTLPSAAGSGGGSESIADLSGIPSITEQFNNQFAQETPPVQAYVVEQQVTESQQINTMIQQKATL